MPNNEDLPKPAPENPQQEAAADVSKRKTTNTKKSGNGAGSKRPKPNNTFFPGKHGLMITRIGYLDGQPVPAIHELYGSLTRRYGLEDPVNALMIELAVVDYWRLGQGHLAEKNDIDGGRYVFERSGWMPTIIRYNTAARRNLEKSLQMLQKSAEQAEAFETGTEEQDAAGSAGDAGSAQQEKGEYTSTNDGPPDKIDPRDFLPESDFEVPAESCEGETAANNNEDMSDDHGSTSTPMPPIQTALPDPTSAAGSGSAEGAPGNTGGNSEGNLPSAA